MAMIQQIAATLVALKETGGAPESSLYLGLGGDIHQWDEVKMILLGAKLIEVKAYWVELTKAGLEQAIAIEALMDKMADKLDAIDALGGKETKH